MAWHKVVAYNHMSMSRSVDLHSKPNAEEKLPSLVEISFTKSRFKKHLHYGLNILWFRYLSCFLIVVQGLALDARGSYDISETIACEEYYDIQILRQVNHANYISDISKR